MHSLYCYGLALLLTFLNFITFVVPRKRVWERKGATRLFVSFFFCLFVHFHLFILISRKRKIVLERKRATMVPDRLLVFAFFCLFVHLFITITLVILILMRKRVWERKEQPDCLFVFSLLLFCLFVSSLSSSSSSSLERECERGREQPDCCRQELCLSCLPQIVK